MADLAGRDGGSGWGLKASVEAGPGSRLVELPTACHLTYSATDDPLSLIDEVPAELWGAKLALQLLAQRLKGGDSAFSQYVSILPRGVPGIPMFFNKQAMDAIDYPPVSQQVVKRCKWLFEFSQNVLSKLPGTPQDPFAGAKVDINALGWAMAAVSSRAFRTRGPNFPASMLPLIDMANHSFDPNCEVLPTPNGVGLFARRKVEAGEPLLLSYGKLSNDFLFMDYGFIIPDNPYDSVQLRFDVGLMQAGCLVSNLKGPSGAPLEIGLPPWKEALLADLRLSGANASLELNIGPASGEAGIEPRLLAAARVLACRDASEVQGRGIDRLADWARPLSKENEEAALRMLSGVCAVALSNFKTTLAQDQELLAKGRAAAADGASAAAAMPLSEDERLAVRFRAEKKRILLSAVTALGLRLRAVRGDDELRDRTSAGQAAKGSKPAAATSKGFGKQRK